MGKLQTGRFERLAARTYSIKGPGALVDLDETVLGVLLLERQGGMESHYIQEWETFSVYNVLGPVAGNYNWFLLNNPPGSGALVVVDFFQRSGTRLVHIWMTRGVPPGFALGGTPAAVDTRIPQARQPSADFYAFNTNIAGFGTQIGVAESMNAQTQPVVLGEDGSIAFRAGAVNDHMDIAVRWAERNSAPFER